VATIATTGFIIQLTPDVIITHLSHLSRREIVRHEFMICNMTTIYFVRGLFLQVLVGFERAHRQLCTHKGPGIHCTESARDGLWIPGWSKPVSPQTPDAHHPPVIKHTWTKLLARPNPDGGNS